MTYPSIPTRLATRVDTRFTQSASWDKGASNYGDDSDCPGYPGGHWQEVDWPTSGIDETFTPSACQHCGAIYDGALLWRSAGSHHVYDTDDGALHPGDIYLVDQHATGHLGSWCNGRWTNCDGWHLHAVLPNGSHWDIDGRASNCTMPGDTEHRCWVRHGTPPNVTVDKNGRTCAAGAGSILVGDYHGFLQAGRFTAG